jgi:hypothetical protein
MGKKKEKVRQQNDSWEDLKTAVTAGGFVGGLLGLLIGLYAAIYHLHPALEDAGFSQILADLTTLAIAVGGGLELSTGLGALLGIIKAFIIFHLVYLPYTFCHQGAHALGNACETLADNLERCSPSRMLKRLGGTKKHDHPHATDLEENEAQESASNSPSETPEEGSDDEHDLPSSPSTTL